MDVNGVPVHYLAAEDNERRLKSRIEAVFDAGVLHLTYHAVMTAEHPLPRGMTLSFTLSKLQKAQEPNASLWIRFKAS